MKPIPGTADLLPPAVSEARASNELEIESIDCTYDGFMILPPDQQDGHTIIWINDSDDAAN